MAASNTKLISQSPISVAAKGSQRGKPSYIWEKSPRNSPQATRWQPDSDPELTHINLRVEQAGGEYDQDQKRLREFEPDK